MKDVIQGGKGMDKALRRKEVIYQLAILSGRSSFEDGFLKSWKKIGSFKAKHWNSCLRGVTIKEVYEIADGKHNFYVGSVSGNV